MIYVYSGKRLSMSQQPEADEVIGALTDVLECTVSRDVDGAFELFMVYPRDGKNAESVKINNWLYCPAGGEMGMQYFRIDQISRGIDGTLDIHASHLYYNAAAILAAPFGVASNDNPATVSYLAWRDALEKAVRSVDSLQWGGFTIVGYTDEMTLNACSYEEAVNVKQVIQDAIKDTGCFLKYQKFGVSLWRTSTTNVAPAFQIRYGKNLMDYSESVDATEFYTHIYPYYVVGDKVATHNGDIYPLEGLPPEYAGWRRIQGINLSRYYSGLDHELDLAILETVIENWLSNHPWNPLPQTISVEALDDGTGRFELGNIGSIYYTPTHTTITAYIVALSYDALRDKVISIDINKREKNITDTIAGLVKGGYL